MKTRGAPKAYWSLRKKLVWTFLVAVLLFTGAIAAYVIFVLRPRLMSEQETRLGLQLTDIANELNSLSRERLNLAIGLARKGEFLHNVMRSLPGEAFHSKEEEESC